MGRPSGARARARPSRWTVRLSTTRGVAAQHDELPRRSARCKRSVALTASCNDCNETGAVQRVPERCNVPKHARHLWQRRSRAGAASSMQRQQRLRRQARTAHRRYLRCPRRTKSRLCCLPHRARCVPSILRRASSSARRPAMLPSCAQTLRVARGAETGCGETLRRCDVLHCRCRATQRDALYVMPTYRFGGSRMRGRVLV